MTTIIEPGSKKELRFAKPRFRQGPFKRVPPSVSTGLTLVCLPPKRREPRYSQFETFVLKALPVEYETRRILTEVSVSGVFKRSSRLPSAVWDEVLNSRRSTLNFFLCPASIIRKHPANIFLTVEDVKFLKKMTWVCGAYQHWKKQRGEARTKVLFEPGQCRSTSMGCKRLISAKRAAELQHRRYAVSEGFGIFAEA